MNYHTNGTQMSYITIEKYAFRILNQCYSQLWQSLQLQNSVHLTPAILHSQ